MDSTVIGFACEPEHYNRLWQISRELFGDGSTLTPDRRRDLANLLHSTLLEFQPLTEGDTPTIATPDKPST